MGSVIQICDYLCELEEADGSCRFDDIQEEQDHLVEEIINDEDALRHLDEEAFSVLSSGLKHRKQTVRTQAITLLAQLFPQSRTFSLFQRVLWDRKEKRAVRFHVALNMIFDDRQSVEEMLQELRGSKGCNDRICAAILMGGLKDTKHIFYLINSFEDSNDCVKIAAFLSLLNYSRRAILRHLESFIARATIFQLKLLEKNICYYEGTPHFSNVSQSLSERLEEFKASKVTFHPEYYEQSYSQEKLSKLDRVYVGDEVYPAEGLSLFEG